MSRGHLVLVPVCEACQDLGKPLTVEAARHNHLVVGNLIETVLVVMAGLVVVLEVVVASGAVVAPALVAEEVEPDLVLLDLLVPPLYRRTDLLGHDQWLVEEPVPKDVVVVLRCVGQVLGHLELRVHERDAEFLLRTCYLSAWLDALLWNCAYFCFIASWVCSIWKTFSRTICISAI